MKELYLKTRAEWRAWLSKNHAEQTEIWLLFYKKETGKQSLAYDDVVEEALCFGWIDSLIKNINQQKYARKITPRNNDSKWSAINIKRVEKLIKAGLMTKAGFDKVETAKKSGLFKPSIKPKIVLSMPPEFEQALKKNRKARDNFGKLPPSHKKNFIAWIFMASRPETKKKRVRESIGLLEKGNKLGLK